MTNKPRCHSTFIDVFSEKKRFYKTKSNAFECLSSHTLNSSITATYTTARVKIENFSVVGDNRLTYFSFPRCTILALMNSIGHQSEKNNLRKTRANLYTSVIKIVGLNYIVVNLIRYVMIHKIISL